MSIFGDLAMSQGAILLMPVVWWTLVFSAVTGISALVTMPKPQLVWSNGRWLTRERIHEGFLSLSVGSAILVVLLCAIVIVQFMFQVHVEG